jgi:hypothetical protein
MTTFIDSQGRTWGPNLIRAYRRQEMQWRNVAALLDNLAAAYDADGMEESAASTRGNAWDIRRALIHGDPCPDCGEQREILIPSDAPRTETTLANARCRRCWISAWTHACLSEEEKAEMPEPALVPLDDVDVPTCPVCGDPAHATDSDDDNVHGECQA